MDRRATIAARVKLRKQLGDRGVKRKKIEERNYILLSDDEAEASRREPCDQDLSESTAVSDRTLSETESQLLTRRKEVRRKRFGSEAHQPCSGKGKQRASSSSRIVERTRSGSHLWKSGVSLTAAGTEVMVFGAKIPARRKKSGPDEDGIEYVTETLPTTQPPLESSQAPPLPNLQVNSAASMSREPPLSEAPLSEPSKDYQWSVHVGGPGGNFSDAREEEPSRYASPYDDEDEEMSGFLSERVYDWRETGKASAQFQKPRGRMSRRAERVEGYNWRDKENVSSFREPSGSWSGRYQSEFREPSGARSRRKQYGFREHRELSRNGGLQLSRYVPRRYRDLQERFYDENEYRDYGDSRSRKYCGEGSKYSEEHLELSDSRSRGYQEPAVYWPKKPSNSRSRWYPSASHEPAESLPTRYHTDYEEMHASRSRKYRPQLQESRNYFPREDREREFTRSVQPPAGLAQPRKDEDVQYWLDNYVRRRETKKAKKRCGKHVQEPEQVEGEEEDYFFNDKEETEEEEEEVEMELEEESEDDEQREDEEEDVAVNIPVIPSDDDDDGIQIVRERLGHRKSIRKPKMIPRQRLQKLQNSIAAEMAESSNKADQQQVAGSEVPEAVAVKEELVDEDEFKLAARKAENPEPSRVAEARTPTVQGKEIIDWDEVSRPEGAQDEPAREVIDWDEIASKNSSSSAAAAPSTNTDNDDEDYRVGHHDSEVSLSDEEDSIATKLMKKKQAEVDASVPAKEGHFKRLRKGSSHAMTSVDAQEHILGATIANGNAPEETHSPPTAEEAIPEDDMMEPNAEECTPIADGTPEGEEGSQASESTQVEKEVSEENVAAMMEEENAAAESTPMNIVQDSSVASTRAEKIPEEESAEDESTATVKLTMDEEDGAEAESTVPEKLMMEEESAAADDTPEDANAEEESAAKNPRGETTSARKQLFKEASSASDGSDKPALEEAAEEDKGKGATDESLCYTLVPPNERRSSAEERVRDVFKEAEGRSHGTKRARPSEVDHVSRPRKSGAPEDGPKKRSRRSNEIVLVRETTVRQKASHQTRERDEIDIVMVNGSKASASRHQPPPSGQSSRPKAPSSAPRARPESISSHQAPRSTSKAQPESSNGHHVPQTSSSHQMPYSNLSGQPGSSSRQPESDYEEEDEIEEEIQFQCKSVPKQKKLMTALINSIVGEDGNMLDEEEDQEKVLVEPSAWNGSKLPQKFRFPDNKPVPEGPTEDDLLVASLFAESGLDEGKYGYDDEPLQQEEEEPPEEEEEPACRHDFYIDETIGRICRICYFVEAEIRDIDLPFAPDPYRAVRFGDREKYSPSKELVFLSEEDDELGDGFSAATGTVWDAIPGSKSRMYEHQQEGFEFMWKNLEGTINLAELKKSEDSDIGGCIISHAPGTGKTLLTLMFINAYLKIFPNSRPMIIAPASMLLTWEEEFKKWNMDFPFHNLNHSELTGKERKVLNFPTPMGRAMDKDVNRLIKIYSWTKERSVLGISYNLFENLVGGEYSKVRSNRQKEKQKKKKNPKSGPRSGKYKRMLLEMPRLVIMDEGHTPRNSNSCIWNTVLKLQTKRKIILTGTPFQNNFLELFNTLRLVRPETADSLLKERAIAPMLAVKGGKYVPKKGKMMESSDTSKESVDKAIMKLKDIISPFVHVHKGHILKRNLPGLKDSVILLKPPPMQKYLIKLIEGSKSASSFDYEYKVALLSTHPSLAIHCSLDARERAAINMDEVESLKNDYKEGVKTRFVVELVRLSIDRGEKVLVFSQYQHIHKLMAEQLRAYFNWEEGKQVIQMHGKQDQKCRQQLITMFNDPKSESVVLLASTKCCSEGINLVGASQVVLLDVVWNPSVERQAISRAYRLGQQKVVHTYHLMAGGTSEGDKYCRQVEKDRLSELVFSSTTNEIAPPASDAAATTATASGSAVGDVILTKMLADDNFKDMVEKIIYQPKEVNLIESFTIASADVQP